MTFAKDLVRRRVPQVIAIYFGACWGLLEFVDFLIGALEVGCSSLPVAAVVIAIFPVGEMFGHGLLGAMFEARQCTGRFLPSVPSLLVPALQRVSSRPARYRCLSRARRKVLGCSCLLAGRS